MAEAGPRHGVIVAQLGARRHYAVPAAFAAHGLLHRLYTDIYAGAGPAARVLRAAANVLPLQALSRWAGRNEDALPSSLVSTFPLFGLEYKRRCRRARDSGELSRAWLWGGKRFCNLIRRRELSGAEAVYVFNSAGLELMQAARDLGLRCIMDQTIAPRSLELRLLREERAAYPGWETQPADDHFLEEYCERERQEWAVADQIVCGSEFVKQGIAEEGGPAHRCTVVRHGSPLNMRPVTRQPHLAPIRVVTVGTVGLRKGAPYVMEAAKHLGSRATFRMVGPIALTPRGESELRQHVELTGGVPRSEVAAHYAWADVFLLPSLCEGSANAAQEALAAGLPVICTPNTGSTVRDGVDGYIVSIRDAAAIVQRIEQLIGSPRTCEAAADTDGDRDGSSKHDYGQRLVAAIRPQLRCTRASTEVVPPTCAAANLRSA